MRNLANLKLQNITLESYDDIGTVLESLQILSNLSIDHSTKLVKPILNDRQLVAQLTRLRFLSLRHTGLVTLTEQNVPENTCLDISHNPLRCDCHLTWIRHKERDTLGKFLLSKEQTTCATPNNVRGNAVTDSVNVTCSDQQTSGILEQTFNAPNWTQTSDYDKWNIPAYITSTSTEVPIRDQLTNTSTASNNTDNNTSSDKTTVYIALGTVLLILIVGTALAVIFSVMKRKRKYQVSTDGDETPMEQQPPQEQMKQASSKDMLIKK
jgi:hypothetical protein